MNRVAWSVALVAASAFLYAGCRSTPRNPGRALQKAMSSTSVEVPSMPTNVEQFVAFRDSVADEAAGGAAVLVVAMNLYAQNEDLGLSCLTIALDGGRLQDGAAYKGKEPIKADQSRFKSRIAAKPYVPRSYFADTSPENGYDLSEGALVVEISEVRMNGDTAKVFVVSTGADSPRPCTLKKNNRGVWKAHEWSSLEVGVRPPSQATDDDL